MTRAYRTQGKRRRRRLPKLRTIIGLTLFFTTLAYQAVYNWLPSYFPMQNYIGVARATDGDSLKLNGQSIRLLGIDAPELRQACHHSSDDDWPCGRLSHQALTDLVEGQTTTCHPVKKDLYRRVLANCFTDEGTNIAEAMVVDGWAFAYSQYSRDFGDDEHKARRAERGIWAAEIVEEPWAYRKKKASVFDMFSGLFGITD